jgi:hypothetical protein
MLASLMLCLAIFACSRQPAAERDPDDPFGPKYKVLAADIRFQRNISCAPLGAAYADRLTNEPGSFVSFYCYSPALNTCVAVVTRSGPNGPIDSIEDLVTGTTIASARQQLSRPENEFDTSYDEYRWLQQLRVSVSNECVVKQRDVEQLAGPAGKLIADEIERKAKARAEMAVKDIRKQQQQ